MPDHKSLASPRVFFLLAATLSLTLSAADQEDAARILNDQCAQCHSKSLALSGLDLSSRDAALKGGSRGPALVPSTTSPNHSSFSDPSPLLP